MAINTKRRFGQLGQSFDPREEAERKKREEEEEKKRQEQAYHNYIRATSALGVDPGALQRKQDVGAEQRAYSRALDAAIQQAQSRFNEDLMLALQSKTQGAASMHDRIGDAMADYRLRQIARQQQQEKLMNGLRYSRTQDYAQQADDFTRTARQKRADAFAASRPTAPQQTAFTPQYEISDQSSVDDIMKWNEEQKAARERREREEAAMQTYAADLGKWRQNRDDILNRYQAATEKVNSISDLNSREGQAAIREWRLANDEAERAGGIDNLLKTQDEDRAGDRRYDALLRGIDPDQMSFGEKFKTVAGGTLKGALEQYGAAQLGQYQNAQTGNILNNVEGEIDDALRLAAKNYLSAVENDPEMQYAGTRAMRDGIVQTASALGGEEYANRVMEYIDRHVSDYFGASGRGGRERDIFRNFDLNNVGRDEDETFKHLRDLTQSGTGESILDYEKMFELQNAGASDLQRAKDVLQSDFGDMLVEGTASRIQSGLDALTTMALGLSGMGAVSMLPFGARAAGGAFAEGASQVMARGEEVGKDMAKNLNKYAGANGAIEMATEMLWGTVGEMGKVSGGGALDEVMTNKLAAALERAASTDRGAKILSTIGKKVAGGIFEGLEEQIADFANYALDTAGIIGEDRGAFADVFTGSFSSFAVGAMAGLLGEASIVGNLQNAQLGRSIRSEDIGILNDIAEAAAAGGELGDTFQKIMDKRGIYQDTDSISVADQADSLRNSDIGKLYQAFEEATQGEDYDDIDRAIKRIEKGKDLTDTDVSRIVRNPYVSNYLEDASGVEIHEETATADAIEALKALASQREAFQTEQADNVQQAEETADTAESERRAELARTLGEKAERTVPSGIRSVLDAELDSEFEKQVYKKFTNASVEDAFNRLGVNGESVKDMVGAYNPGQNMVGYTEETTRFYNQGHNGYDMDMSAMNALSTITPAQAKIAYNAGRSDLLIEEASDERTGAEAVRLREGGERNDGARTGRQVRELEARSGPDQIREAAAEARDRAVAQVETEPEAITAKSIGIANGTDDAKVYLVTGNYTPAMAQGAVRAKKYGLTARYFVGGDMSLYDGGQVRGVINGDEIWVRADDPEYAGDSITEHEITHKRIRDGEIDVEEVWNRRSENLTAARLDWISKAYTSAFTDENGDLIYDEDDLMEEIVCDAVAKMNLFQGLSAFEGEAEEIYSGIRENVEATKKDAGEASASETKYSQVSKYLRELHKEYETDEENLRIAAEGVSDLIENIERVSSSEGKGVLDRQGRKSAVDIRTIGNGISAQFIRTGRVNINKTRIRNTEDLAQLCQIFRDPRFETIRYFYVRNNRIVGTDAVSCRLPNMSKAFSGDFDPRDLLKKINRVKADGVYLMHNHPSGNVRASTPDIDLTKQMAQLINKHSDASFLGHIIIDHQIYNELQIADKKYGEVSTEEKNLSGQVSLDLLLTPSVNADFIGDRVINPDEVASIGQEIISGDDSSAIIYTDSQGHIRQMQDVSNKTLTNNKQIGNYIRNQRVKVGAGMAFVFTTNKAVSKAMYSLYTGKLLTDVVLDTNGFWESMASNPSAYPKKVFKDKNGQTREYEYGLNEKQLAKRTLHANEAVEKYGMPDTKFSMRSPLERTDRLIALHNMNEDALKGMLELGGLAMPSVAITRSDMGHNSYGPISAVFGRSSISPTNRKNVIYGGDAWTPTFPEVGIKINSKEANKVYKKLKDLLGAEAKEYNMALDADNMSDQIKRWGSFAEAYGRHDAARLAFLRDTGRQITIPTKTKVYTNSMDNLALKQLAKKIDLEDARKGSESYSKYKDVVKEALKNYYNRKYGNELGEKLYGKKEDLGYANYDNIIRAAVSYAKNGETKIVDRARLEKRLDIAFKTKKVQTEYKAWLESLGENLIEKRGIRNNTDFFTPYGNRRSFEQLYYPYTLANIVKAMEGQAKQGKTGFLTGAGNIKGAAAQKYASVEAARKDIDRLKQYDVDLSGEKDPAIEAFNNHTMELCAKMVEGKGHNSFGGVFDAAEVLTEVIPKYQKADQIYRYLMREGYDGYYNVTPEIAKEIEDVIQEARKLPTQYFEGKMYRAVPITEALAYVVPDNMDKGLKQKLVDAGANVVTYKHGDNEDRLKKVNGIEGAKFSKRANTEYLAAVQRGDMETAQRMVDEAAKENGYTIKAYHGTAKEFTEFSRKTWGENHDGYMEFGAGFYFTPSEKEAREWIHRGRAGLSGKVNENILSVYLAPGRTIEADSAVPGGEESLMAMGLSRGDARFISARAYRFINYLLEDKGFSNAEVQDELKALGYDAVSATYNQGKSGQYVVFDPEQVKSADPVTYDNNGNIIPLSERFDDTKRDIRYSKRANLDKDYMAAVESGDTAEQERLVKEAAAEAGYTVEGYHGTQQFGFTKIDTRKSDDHLSFFVTTDIGTARTYSRANNTREINAGADETQRKRTEEKRKAAEETLGKFVETYNAVANKYSVEEINGYNLRRSLWGLILNSVEGDWWTVDIFADEFDSAMREEVNKLWRNISDHGENRPKSYWEWQYSDENLSLTNTIGEVADAYLELRNAAEDLMGPENSGNYHVFINPDGILEVEGDGRQWRRLKFIPPEVGEARKKLDDHVLKRNDVLFPVGKTEQKMTPEQREEWSREWYREFKRLKEINSDAMNKHMALGWSNLDNASGSLTTRSIARYAKNAGYTGVLFHNIIDDGGKGSRRSGVADVYALFNPQEQVKSADPVTYDENGEVIPLSERFNKKNDDIRFSKRANLDSLGKELSEKQTEFFKDSKVRDENGNLLVMFHATDADFTVFQGREDYLHGYYYFSTKKRWSKSFFRENYYHEPARVLSVYLNLKNPFDVTEYEYLKTAKEWLNIMREHGVEVTSSMENHHVGAGAEKTYNRQAKIPFWRLVQYDFNKGDYITDYKTAFINAGYDGIHLLDSIAGAGRWAEGGDTYVAFDSNQAKLTTNKNPSDNEDIRFSRRAEKSFAELTKENEHLRKDLSELKRQLKIRTEQKDYWKGQTKVTEGRRVRLDDSMKLARTIAKEYDGKIDAEAVGKKMKDLAEFCLNAKEFDDAFFETARMKSQEIAHDILENAKILQSEGDPASYEKLRDYLRNTKLYVPGNMQHDLSADYQAFRKSLMGTVTLTTSDTSATGIDQAYKELQGIFGEGLFPDDITHPADQLMRVLEILESFKPVYERMNSVEMAEAVEWAANDILGRVVGEEIRQTDPTYADKMEARLKETREKAKEDLKKVREQRDRQIAELKQHYKEVAADKRARRLDSEARTKLLNIARRLNNRKLGPATRALLDQYIGDLDLVSKGITGKTIHNLEALRDWYQDWTERQKAELGDDFVPDSYIENMIDRLYKKRISDMTQQEVADLTTILRNIETMVRTENKFIDSQERRDTYASALELIEDYRASKAKTDGDLTKALLSGLLSPERMAHRIAGYNDADPLYRLTKELSDGQRRMFDYRRRAEELFSKWVNDKKFIREIAGKDAKWIKVKGLVDGTLQDVEITPAMRMALYLHAKSEDNLTHVENGGVLVPNKDLYIKGKLDDAYKDGIGTKAVFSRYMIHEITQKMSAKERAFADAAFEYFNTMSKDAINSVSVEHVGYEIARVRKYFPMDVSRDFLSSDFGEVRPDGTVASAGFLKERVKGAKAPLMLYDMNSVLDKSIEGHSKYYGLAMPIRNLNKLLNVKLLNNEGSVRNNLLTSHIKYLDKAMRDVQTGVEEKDSFTQELLSKFRSHYAGGVLALNAGVAVKQAASYSAAASVIGYTPLLKALKDVGKVDLDLINKYTPLLWYRRKGYSNAELGDIGKRGGLSAEMMSHKTLNWIQGVDVLTTTKLWKAAEYYVQENNKSLKKGTDAYYKEVASVYNRVIEETQPNYAPMQRPGVLRSSDQLTRSLNMFKTQPFQNANVLVDAFGNMNAKARQYKANPTEANKEALTDARKAAGRAVTSQALSAFIFSLMQFAWDMIRGKTYKYKDDDDEMDFWTVNRALLLNMVTSLGGMVPFGGTALEFLESTADKISSALGGDPIFDQKFYGLSENSLEAVNDFAEAVQALTSDTIKAFRGEAAAETSARSIVDNMATLIQMTTGLPGPNVVSDLKALALNAMRGYERANGKGRIAAEFAALRVTTDPNKYKADYFALLKKAWRKYPEAFTEIRQDMIEMAGDPFATSSKTAEENIDAKVKEWQKEQAKTESFYQITADSIQASPIWQQADDKQHETIMNTLLSLAAGHDDATQKKIDDGENVGIDATEYLLYKLALSVADENGGSHTNADYEKAIGMVDGLTDEERSYLWHLHTDSDKNNPWAAPAVTRGGSMTPELASASNAPEWYPGRRRPTATEQAGDVNRRGEGVNENPYMLSRQGVPTKKRRQFEQTPGGDVYRKLWSLAVEQGKTYDVYDTLNYIASDRQRQLYDLKGKKWSYENNAASFGDLYGTPAERLSQAVLALSEIEDDPTKKETLEKLYDLFADGVENGDLYDKDSLFNKLLWKLGF